jgi:hypothetical protein
VQSACIAYGLPSLIPTPTGADDELLIVKTDLNSAGTREQLLPEPLRKRFSLPLQAGPIKNPKGYFVRPRAQITPDLWNDRELVVERFLTNAAGRFFRVYVMKQAVVISTGCTQNPLKRMSRDVGRKNYCFWRAGESVTPFDEDTELPPALLRTLGVFTARFGVDYAAIDVIESDTGEFYIVDVNKTPYWGSEFQPGLLEHLRRGLNGDAVRGASGSMPAPPARVQRC